MAKLNKGIDIDGSTIRISMNMASYYVPTCLLDYLPCFKGYYYCKE